MFAAVTRLIVQPERIAEAVRAMEESLPALKQEAGHCGALFLTGDTGDILIIGL